MDENEPEDEHAMQREWLQLQHRRLELDAQRDELWAKYIARQTEALERIATALEKMSEQ